ncbi:prolyl oligopeptidase family serine peptidase [Pseudonocardia sp.]|uniref:S9 family peptidase n=1 Tax=Pseudonocardia sp. TaxID=60912 RepID=UPI003D10F69F
MTAPAPFGSWPTPLTSELVVAAAVRLGEVRVDPADPGSGTVWWAEGRPAEGGRTQIVRRDPDGTRTDLLPEGYDARTAVHEYGGAAWWVHGGTVWFTNWADQRLHRLRGEDGPVAVSPEPQAPRGDRWADGELGPDGALVLVREHHAVGAGPAQVRNEIARLAGDGTVEVLVSGPDFVTSPRLDAAGARLAWVSWDHPSMPWDDTVLTVRDLATGADTVVAGGPGESVSEPRWQTDGSLLFVSDRTGWWSLYRWTPADGVTAVLVDEAEIGVPGWTLGTSRHVTLADGRIVVAARRDGYDRLLVRSTDGAVQALDLPLSTAGSLQAAGPDQVVLVAGSPTREASVWRVTLGNGRPEVLRPARDLGVDEGYLSVPEPIEFPSTDGDGVPRTAHALFYPPASATHRGRDGELPPLLVVIHGGPTASASPVLSVGVQYWTSRGFAVVDVDYGGSTGYGRAYRDLLKGAWGIVDVADCIAAARWLGEQGRVDPQRLAIRGGSAGGYTTLAALARDDTPFAAGADHFGVADLEALAADTHKFESRYLDGLVGRYPQERDVYVERSPIHHVERFTKPLIVLQGSEDAIVPPNQSQAIVDALRSRRVPVAYLLFEGEQHGFRRGENIRRAMDAELSFYGQVLGFDLPAGEGIEPVEIER